MTTHFTADHFGLIGLSARPFASVEEMDDRMVAAWNQVVQPSDTVWHVGDFAHRIDARRERAIFSRLNGSKQASCSFKTAIICPSVNLARFICPSFFRPDSNSNWKKISVAGHADSVTRHADGSALRARQRYGLPAQLKGIEAIAAHQQRLDVSSARSERQCRDCGHRRSWWRRTPSRSYAEILVKLGLPPALVVKSQVVQLLLVIGNVLVEQDLLGFLNRENGI
jgi:hypothetical protein